jgi:hypothetical protein
MTEPRDTADFLFGKEDAERLIDALSKMAHRDHLPKRQWGLLLSIFAAAAGHVEVSGDETEGTFSGIKVDGGVIEDPEGENVEALREQLQKAYMPGPPPTSIVSMVSPPPPGG